MSLGRLPPWATINQPQGRQQQVDGWLCCLHTTPAHHVPPGALCAQGQLPSGQASPLSMLREQGSSSQSSLSRQLDWAFQVLAKPAPVASTSPPAVLKSSPSRPLKFPQRPEGPGQGWEVSGVRAHRPEGGLRGGRWAGPLTLHQPLGGVVQRQEELHDRHQLDLQPEAEGGGHDDVVGGRLKDGEARCKAGEVKGRGGLMGRAPLLSPPPPPSPSPLLPPPHPLPGMGTLELDSPVTWGRFTCSSFSRTLPSNLKATTCGQGRAYRGLRRPWGPPGRWEGRGRGTHVLLVISQQHHRLQAGLLVGGAAGRQLAQDGVGVVVGVLRGGQRALQPHSGWGRGPAPPTCPPRVPATLVST